MFMQRLLHIGSKEYDYKNPTYACGTPVDNSNITDEQAMALKTCVECFPNGFTPSAVDVRIETEHKPTKEGLRVKRVGAWI